MEYGGTNDKHIKRDTMKGVITIFTLPTEIEDLALTLNNLKRASNHIKQEVEFKVDITMCLSDTMVNWKKTPIPKEYIISRVKEYTKKLLDWCHYELYFEHGNEILGCDSHRRKSLLNNQDADFFIILDCDVITNDVILNYITSAYKGLTDKGLTDFIITPQINKMWDKSWDVITNKKYKNWTHKQALDSDPYKETIINETVNLIGVPSFKFAGGWFTTISKSLFNKIGVPDSFGHYGSYDTYIMQCCSIMTLEGIPINQFVMENCICWEYFKYRTNDTIKDYICLIDRKDEYRKISNVNYKQELINFANKLKK